VAISGAERVLQTEKKAKAKAKKKKKTVKKHKQGSLSSWEEDAEFVRSFIRKKRNREKAEKAEREKERERERGPLS